MQGATEYQIYIGCTDAQSRDEVISEEELREAVTRFFARRQMGFSLVAVQGGYFHRDGSFVKENSLCIHVIGGDDFDAVRLAKGLAMYMNQECSLVVRRPVRSEYREEER